jgi:hypothetical protein
MRIGDLDALYDKVSDHVTSVSVCATVQQAIGQTDFKQRCLEDIHNAPTIDAIPMGWLIDRANDPERAPLYRRYAQMLYEEWQKEQEAANETGRP